MAIVDWVKQDLDLILWDVKSFVKTCIPVNVFVFFVSSPVIFFFKNSVLIDLQ